MGTSHYRVIADNHRIPIKQKMPHLNAKIGRGFAFRQVFKAALLCWFVPHIRGIFQTLWVHFSSTGHLNLNPTFQSPIPTGLLSPSHLSTDFLGLVRISDSPSHGSSHRLQMGSTEIIFLRQFFSIIKLHEFHHFFQVDLTGEGVWKWGEILKA